MYNKVKNKIVKFIKLFEIIDPVKHCEVYKEKGCAFVDGFLCDVKDCSIRKDHNQKTPNAVTIAAMEEAREMSKRNKQG